jgi:hypothetical protein
MQAVYVAMWSGPRNISTALMRSFESRRDCQVVDEPFYGHYLRQTGKIHPMGDQIMATMECDAGRIAEELRSPLQPGIGVHYQKHMAHHLLPQMDRSWMEGMRHAFLIREPRAMLASLGAKLGPVRLEDTGLPQQVELFREQLRAQGAPPPVIDSADLLNAPGLMLSALCKRLDIPNDDHMLRWESGPRTTDGIWGSHWYANTEKSTGFSAPPSALPSAAPGPSPLTADLELLLPECERLYQLLTEHRIQPVL